MKDVHQGFADYDRALFAETNPVRLLQIRWTNASDWMSPYHPTDHQPDPPLRSGLSGVALVPNRNAGVVEFIRADRRCVKDPNGGAIGALARSENCRAKVVLEGEQDRAKRKPRSLVNPKDGSTRPTQI